MTWLLTIGLLACTAAFQIGIARLRIEAYFLPKEWFLHATALAALIVLALRRARLTVRAIDVCLAGFVAVGLVSASRAFNPWLAARSEAVVISASIVFFVAADRARAGDGPRLRRAVSAAVLVLVATVVYESYLPHAPVALSRAQPGGLAGHRNHMAHALAICLPCLLSCAYEARSRAGRIVLLAGVAGTSAALVLSRCRAAWLATLIAAIVAITFACLARKRIFDLKLLPLTAATAIGIVVAVAVPNLLHWKGAHPYRDSLMRIVDAESPSGHGRLIQDATLLAVARDHPLIGVGPGNWIVHYPEHAPPGDPNLDPPPFVPLPRTTWFAWLAEWGIVGFALLVVAALLALRMWHRGLRSLVADECRASLVGLGTLTTAAVTGAFDAVLQPPLTAFLFFLIAGSCVGTTVGEARRDVPRPVAALLLAGASLATLVALAHTSVQLYADRIAQGCLIRSVERAARIYPGSTLTHRLLARDHFAADRCADARREAELALALEPHAADMIEVVRACDQSTSTGEGRGVVAPGGNGHGHIDGS